MWPILGIYKSPTDTWMWKLGLGIFVSNFWYWFFAVWSYYRVFDNCNFSKISCRYSQRSVTMTLITKFPAGVVDSGDKLFGGDVDTPATNWLSVYVSTYVDTGKRPRCHVSLEKSSKNYKPLEKWAKPNLLPDVTPQPANFSGNYFWRICHVVEPDPPEFSAVFSW